MVQKYQSPVRIFRFPFEFVMAAYEKRFPTCKMIPVFLGSEMLYDYLSEDNAVRIQERRCKLNVDAPYILKKIVGVDYVYFIQKNYLDRRNRTLKIEAHNDSFASRVTVKENCFYSVHPENPNWTCFEQDASMEIKSFFGFESTVEKLAMKQYTQNIKKGKEVIEYYINELISEGISYIPIWSGPPASPRATICDQSHKRKLSTPARESLQLGAAIANIPPDTLNDDPNFKLEADYIKRCLGELNPVQESSLIHLRKWLAETHKGKMPNDAHLLRFLRARDFNVEKAREMLCHSLMWRKQYQIDRILGAYQPPPVLQQYFPGGWHHCDKEGRPVYVLRLGVMDVKGLLKAVGEEGLLKLTLSICEEGIRRTEEATKSYGKPISSWTCIVDLEGLSMRHLWRPGVKALLRIIEVVETNYPETMGCVLIIRAPRVFPVLWTLINPFIDENTRNKFMIYGGNDYQGPGGLVDYIDKEHVPDFLGGECQANLQFGGLVPKTLYMLDDEVDRDRSPEDPPLCTETLYHSTSLVRGSLHEELIQISEKDSVITWDFDVIKGDCVFTVIYSKNSIPSIPHIHHHSLGAIGSSTIQTQSYLDRTAHVDVDYFKIENSLVCRDGDSIQGSHVCSRTGSYLLQWKYHESLTSHHTFDFSLSPHKCKIMYYYETLNSRDFRGSMTSLQSSHSGFSSLSIASSSNQSGVSSTPSR